MEQEDRRFRVDRRQFLGQAAIATGAGVAGAVGCGSNDANGQAELEPINLVEQTDIEGLSCGTCFHFTNESCNAYDGFVVMAEQLCEAFFGAPGYESTSTGENSCEVCRFFVDADGVCRAHGIDTAPTAWCETFIE